MKATDFLKNMIKYCVPSVVSALVGIAVIPIISRIYPTADYGKINLFYSVGNMILYIAFMGLDSAYIRYYFEQPEGVNRAQLFKLAFWTGTIVNGFILLLSLLFFREAISEYLFGEKQIRLIVLLSLYIFGLIQYRLLSIETRMDNKAFLFNAQQILLIFTNRVSFVVVALWSTNYKYALYAITISSILLGLVFTIIQKKPRDFAFPRLSHSAYLKVMAFAIPLMPTTVMTWISNSAAKMILTGFKDFNAVGILSIATSVANVFSIVPSAFATYWSPFIYKNYKNEQEFIKKVHGYICALSLLIVIVVFSLQDILYFIVGSNYKSSQAYFLMVMMGPIQSLICETTSYGIVLSSKTKYNLYISLVALLMNISMGYFLYPVIGEIGVVIGIFSAAVVQLVLKSIIGQKYYKSIDDVKKSVLSCFTIAVLCLTNYFLYDQIMIRVLISIIVIALWIFLYHKQILEVKKFITRFLQTKRKCPE